MTVSFDINLNAWISNIEVSGDNLADCRSKLETMTLLDLVEAGATVKAKKISDVDEEITEERFLVTVSSIDFDLDDDAFSDDDEKEQLNQELNKRYCPLRFEVICNPTYLVEEIEDEILDRLNYYVNGIDYTAKPLDR